MTSTVALAYSPPALAPDFACWPTNAVDLVIDAALRVSADCAWLEPVAATPDRYAISIEREGAVVVRATVDTTLGTAMIARLARICDLEFAPVAQSGSTRVRTATNDELDLVFTLRPSPELRGELVFLRRPANEPTVVVADGTLARGTRVDQYRVLDVLGAGGMGAVYRVEHAELGRICAMKLLHTAVLERDERSSDRFLREARAAARIRNPHIVDVYDFGYLPDGRPYFVMEHLEGESVAALLARETPAPARAVAIASQLCDALAAAHEHGVIHADVTPSNVILCDGPQLEVKLVDFGLAELCERRDPSAEIPDYILGTPLYISPEQIRGAPADERSDQYAAGAVLFELLVGRPPFYADDVHALCLEHIYAPVPEIASPHGKVPDALAAIVRRALAKDPADRFTSMLAMRAELEHVMPRLDRTGWRRWVAS